MTFEEIEKLGRRIAVLKEEKEQLVAIKEEDSTYNSINLQSGRNLSRDYHLNISTSRYLIETLHPIINALIEKRIKDITKELESIN